MIKNIIIILAISFGLFSDEKSDADNHSNQGNPNNDAYWESRGYEERPDDWENRTSGGYNYEDDDDYSDEVKSTNHYSSQSDKYDGRYIESKSDSYSKNAKYMESSGVNYCAISEIMNGKPSRKASQGWSSEHINRIKMNYAKKCIEQKERINKYRKEHPIKYALEKSWRKYSKTVYYSVGIIFILYLVKKLIF